MFQNNLWHLWLTLGGGVLLETLIKNDMLMIDSFSQTLLSLPPNILVAVEN